MLLDEEGYFKLKDKLIIDDKTGKLLETPALEVVRDHNKKLIELYPFLKPRNVFTDKEIEGYNYEFTWLDDMPYGWRKAFGIKMMEELKEQLLKDNQLNDFRIDQIKEKFGSLRFYINSGTNRIYDIIDKYEALSKDTCIMCGNKAEYESLGWISPYCERCAHRLSDGNIDKLFMKIR